MIRTAAAVILSVGLSSLPAVADDRYSDSDAVSAAPAATKDSVTAPRDADIDWSKPPLQIGSNRGAVLPSLYVSLAALQAFDGYTTMTGMQRGAREANPLMSGVAGSSPTLWAVKGGAAFASIYFAERLWKRHHRAEAIALMVASNGLMVAVAAHNAAVLRSLR